MQLGGGGVHGHEVVIDLGTADGAFDDDHLRSWSACPPGGGRVALAFLRLPPVPPVQPPERTLL